MVDYTNCDLQQVSVHQVGNKANEGELHLSKSMLDVSDANLKELLFHYFLKPFTETEFYNFAFSGEELSMNPLFNYANTLFEDPDAFHINSIKIARHLYEVTHHPNIKPGDLFVARFINIQVNEEPTEAIGIFKAENKQSFLKINHKTEDIILDYEEGIHIDKLDKGCLIFNIDKEEGYKVTMIDKSNKSLDAQYWKDSFLNLKACNDDYHSTAALLNMTKDFVTKQIPEEFEVGKADQIDMLNRSVEYFKSNESFNKEDFEEKVLHQPEVIESFRNFDNAYKADNDLSFTESFEISPQAVKKQARNFKSVLKLDKNFHIYIHGDRSKIEQGVDANGQKYYKIYYDQEQ